MALRDVARGVAAAAGGMVLVGGPTAMQADTWAISNHDTILVALIALIVVGVILALLRALMAPPYLLAINVLSYLAALGATILITEKLFEWEHITTRMRSEAIVHGLKAGTVCALAATGGVPTSTGVILPGTFLILLSQPVKDLVEIRIGVAIGVLIRTFLVRTVLVPGLTLALGPVVGGAGQRGGGGSTRWRVQLRRAPRRLAVQGGFGASRFSWRHVVSMW